MPLWTIFHPKCFAMSAFCALAGKFAWDWAWVTVLLEITAVGGGDLCC